jgi:hypothetical protein
VANGEGLGVILPLGFLGDFGGAIEFIFSPQENRFTGGREVGGLDQVWELTLNHIELSFAALAVALVLALPTGAILGHYGSRSRSATHGARSRSWPWSRWWPPSSASASST